MMGKTSFQPRKPSGLVALTSLMDVLTILLVFILVNHKSDSAGDLPQYASLPLVSASSPSTGESDLSGSVSIVITENWVQVGDTRLSNPGGDPSFPRTLVETLIQERHRGGVTRGSFVVQADARTPYRKLDVIVSAASALGVGRIRFMGVGGGRD